MKLATIRNGTRDGELVIVSRDLGRRVAVPEISRTLQAALDDWDRVAPALDAIAAELDAGRLSDAAPFDPRTAMAPLPRPYQWADGSAYVNHVELVRRARGATMPPEFWSDPLMYQGASDNMLGACDDIVLADEAWGIDFEAEVAVVTGDVPMATKAADAGRCIRLLMLVNDVQPAQSHPGGAREGLRVLPVEARERVLAGRRHAGRARRRLARRQGPPAARVAPQWRAVRTAERRRRHDVRLPDADRARRPDARARGRQHRRFGDGVEQGKRRSRTSRGRWRDRLFLHRRAAHRRDDPDGQRDHAVHALRRPGPDRDDRCRRAARCSAPSTRRSVRSPDRDARRPAAPAKLPGAWPLLCGSRGSRRAPYPGAATVRAPFRPFRRLRLERVMGAAYDASRWRGKRDRLVGKESESGSPTGRIQRPGSKFSNQETAHEPIHSSDPPSGIRTRGRRHDGDNLRAVRRRAGEVASGQRKRGCLHCIEVRRTGRNPGPHQPGADRRGRRARGKDRVRADHRARSRRIGTPVDRSDPPQSPAPPGGRLPKGRALRPALRS